LIKRASRPPKAPATVAAEKKRARRREVSYLRYQTDRKKETPLYIR
jgi:hypothetical protein